MIEHAFGSKVTLWLQQQSAVIGPGSRSGPTSRVSHLLRRVGTVK
jgi:hypothetical protein